VRLPFLFACGFGLALACLNACSAPPAADVTAPTTEMPVFEVDPRWPSVPPDWTWDEVIGIAVDANNHVWLTTEGRVGEFDQHGKLVRAWSAQGANREWSVIHGLFVDAREFVWAGARDEHQILKFTREGQLILTIGRRGETGGSNVEQLLGRPSEMYVTPDTNEVFVADGYVNRRVVVFDGENGRYLRHWGAYGRKPEDVPRARRSDDDVSTPPYFSVVHGITGSRDGLIYVGDRTNNRIQVFRRDGTYLQERTIRPGSGAAFAVALSPDADQQFVYVADGTHHKVWVLRRADLHVLGSIGTEGTAPGQFGIPHNVATDTHGNLYVTEAIPGLRAQKFVLKSGPPAS
jgi:DNA-binding beta-propeller fold protein YncE